MRDKRLLKVEIDGREIDSLPMGVLYVVAYSPLIFVYLVIAFLFLVTAVLVSVPALVVGAAES